MNRYQNYISWKKVIDTDKHSGTFCIVYIFIYSYICYMYDLYMCCCVVIDRDYCSAKNLFLYMKYTVFLYKLTRKLI